MSRLILPAESDYALALREPNLLVPGKKPVGPVDIAWSDPLAKKTAFFVLHNATGVSAKEISDYRNVLTSAAATQRESGGMVYSTVGNYVELDTKLTSLTNFAIVHVYKPFSLDTNGYISDFEGINKASIIRGYHDGYYNIYATTGYPSGNNPLLSQMPITGSGIIDAVGYSIIGSTLLGAVNGVQYVNTSVNFGTITPTGTDIRIGGNWNFNNSASGVLYASIGFNGPISADELKRITQNPYQFLRPANDTPFALTLPAVAPSTVTLSNLTFSARTATSITPRLDVTVS